MKHVACAHVALELRNATSQNEVLYGPLSAAIVAFPLGFDEFGFDVILIVTNTPTEKDNFRSVVHACQYGYRVPSRYSLRDDRFTEVSARL